jgi:protease-4
MTLATTIFGLSLALNVYLLLFSGLLGGGSSQQSALVEGDPQQTVAVIPIVGAIYADGSARFNRFISLAEKDPTVKAIVIEIDSPGGTVTASDEIYHRILKFRGDHPNIPIVTSMSSLGASGGYYVACATPEIYAQPTTITGSIGVMMPNYNFSGLMEEWGIADTSIVAEGAFYKDVGSPTTRPDARKTAHLQDLADTMFKQFKDIVVQGRGSQLKANIEDVANGKVFLANDAVKLGLVDKVGYLEDAYTAVAAKAGLSNPNVVRYQDPPTLFDVLAADSSVPPVHAKGGGVKAVSVNNGVNVNVDLGSLSELATPRLMYMWRGE